VKVLILVFYYSPDLSAGSFKNSALVQELSRQIGKKNSIEVITTHPSRYASFQQSATDVEKVDNITIRRIRLPTVKSGFLGQSFVFLFYAAQAIRLARKGKYDLVYASSSRLMTGSLGAFISRLQKAAYYLDIRDIFVDTIQHIFPAHYMFVLLPAFEIVERLTISRASKINLVSAGFENYFSKRFSGVQKSFHTNGIDDQFLDPKLNTKLAKNKPGNPLVFVYAGNFGDGQSLHTIVPSLAKSLEGSAIFRMIGDGRRRPDLDDGILHLTLNDTNRRNALSEAMLAALGAAFDAASTNPDVRVIILAAAGPVFCAGHDLKEMTAGRQNADRGRAYFTKILHQCSSVMQKIVTCPKPVIAEIDGVATAAGCQLVASCDLAVASEIAQFCTPGVHIGLFCSTPMVALSRNLANKHAMEMLLTGDMVPASRAAEMGLVNQVVPSGELRAASMALAQKIAAKSSLTVATGKRAFYQQKEMDLAAAYNYASEIMVENMLARDAEEGIAAFIEKRTPDWRDE
jgi:enoyl-CoA hydratase/carnithine racemase